MTDDQKRTVMKWLGEEIKPDREYHCYGKIRESGETNNCHCFTDGKRDFTTPQDFMDCFDKMVELGEWEEFYGWARTRYKQSFMLLWKDVSEEAFSVWYHGKNPDGTYRLCELVGEWLEKGEGE